MKPRHKALLGLLRECSRISLTQLSIKSKIPLSSVYKAVERIKADYDVRFVALPDFPKIGFPFRLVVLLKANNRDNLKEFLLQNGNLNTLCRLSGEFDFHADLIFPNMEDCQGFMDSLEGCKDVKRAKSFLCMLLSQEAFRLP